MVLVELTPANANSKIPQQFYAFRGMGNFGMELYSVIRLRFMRYAREGGMLGFGDRAKVQWQLRKSISMAHIHLKRVSEAFKELVYVGAMTLWNNDGLPILALCTGYDVGVRESKCDCLKAVANP